jgi:peptidoglycan/LPS O-acetylase OafA/YrhL
VRASAEYLPDLDALRGVAILLVFLYHAAGIGGGVHGPATGTWVSPVRAFVMAGHTGVTMFFVLSAFLLSRPFLEQARGGRDVDRRRFLHRRALRILPLYWSAVIAAILLTASFEGVVGGLQALFFLNSFTGLVEPLFPYSVVWWSLATEVQFYLLLPVLGPALCTQTGRRGLLALGLLWGLVYAALALRVVRPFPDPVYFELMLSVFGRAPAFLAGIAAAWLVLHHGSRLRAALGATAWLRGGGTDALLLLVVGALGMLLREVTYRGFWLSELRWNGWHVLESALWGAVLLLVLSAPLRLRPLLSNRVNRRIGILSYSLFLWHYPVLYVLLPLLRRRLADLGPELANVLATLALLVLCVGLSALSYRWIERPFLERKTRLAS